MLLDEQSLQWFILEGLKEDVRDGDHTSNACIPKNQISKGKLLIKDSGVLCGVPVAKAIFEYLDPQSELDIIWHDGAQVEYGDVAFFLNCNSRTLLQGERLALNILQRLSGIATMSRRFAKEVKDMPVTILDTRKTTPLLRFLEKYAVSIGGCQNYRSGLYDRFMIKDNHIKAAGSITKAVKLCQQYQAAKDTCLDMTIEVRTFEELYEVLTLDVKARIMLDNMSVEQLYEAVRIIDGRQEIEASGGVRLDKLRAIAATGVNYISVGALTHSAPCLDISLKVVEE